jgi:hypothetical protein
MWPNFEGYPGGATITLGISWGISCGYNGTNGRIQIRNSTNSTGNVHSHIITNEPVTAPGIGTSGTASIFIPAANVANFNFKVEIDVNEFEDMFGTSINIRATSILISGINNYGWVDTTEDNWLLFDGYYDPARIPDTWESDVRVN